MSEDEIYNEIQNTIRSIWLENRSNREEFIIAVNKKAEEFLLPSDVKCIFLKIAINFFNKSQEKVEGFKN